MANAFIAEDRGLRGWRGHLWHQGLQLCQLPCGGWWSVRHRDGSQFKVYILFGCEINIKMTFIYDMVWHRIVIWYDIVSYPILSYPYHIILYHTISYHIIPHGYDMIYDIVSWYDMIWHDLVWYRVISYHSIIYCHMGTSCLGYELSWVRVVLGRSCLGYELSWVWVVLGTSCLGYELSWVRVVLGTSCLWYELSRSHCFGLIFLRGQWVKKNCGNVLHSQTAQ